MDLNKFIDENLDELIENPDFLLDFTNSKLIPKFDNIKKYEQNEQNNEEDQEDNEDNELNKYDGSNEDNEEDDEPNKDNEEDDEPNEDNEEDDELGELYQDKFEKKYYNLNNEDSSESDEDIENKKKKYEETDNEFYFSLINVFMKYFNEKFEKTVNFFSGIKDYNKDTSNQMELFFEAILEFKQLKENIMKEYENIPITKTESEIETETDENINNKVNEITLKFIFSEDHPEKIQYLFENWKNQIYCLTINLDKNKIKLFSPSIIVCLNYILENNLDVQDNWNIFNLREC